MNIKMRKFMYICLAFVVVFCTSLTGKNTKSYAVENDYDSRYVGWTKATEANYDEAIYVSKENTDLTDVANAVVAYCFNFTYATPPYVDKGEEEAGKTKPTYIKNKATTQLFEELATSKRVSGDELVKAITKVVYNGYPHNAGGIKGSLSDGRFRAVTQYAVWYFTDSRVQEGLSSEEKEVFEQLTGQKEGAIEVPENVTLDIYKNTMEVKASTATNAAKPEYQHLLAATLVDKNTGKEITVTPQKTFDVHAKKEWANLPVTGGKTDVELTLYKDNQKVQFSDGQDNPKKVLSTDTQGEVSWKNLKGELSDYTIKEENVPANFEASAVTGSGTKEDPYTITNTYKNQSTTSITVTKQWSGEGVPEVKPDVYFELFKFGQPEAGTRKQLTDGKVVWDNIAPEDIMFYSVSEVDKDGKPWKAENYKAGRVQKVSNTEYTVTNEYTAPEPVAPVTKEIQISKVNLGGEEIAGAEIKILKSGAEVASWTSEAGKTKELKLEAGEYTFHEEAAPQGYKVVTDIKFTVEEDGTVKVVEKSENDKAEATGNKLTVTDDYTETKVKFSKKALTENGKELAGAEIELQTENGKVIENWESDGTIKEFNLKPRNYKFIEKAAPQGYALATEISFTVNTDGTVVSNGVKVESEAPIVMVDAYAKQEIQISKVNLGGEEIAGAEIEIQKDGKVVESWTSEKDKTHVVNLEAGEYTFHEKVAPEGYEVVTDITFKVEENGQVTVTNVNGNEVKAEGNKLTVTDKESPKAPEKKEIQISKVNLGGEEIAGAEIEIQKDGKVVESWTSEKDKTHVVNLEAGEYTFHEKVAPEGYEVVTDITFKVEENGQVTVTNINGNEVKAEGNKLTVTDKESPKAPEKKEIQISKVNLGGEEIAGAEIEIQKDGKVVESWTSEKDKTHVVNLEAGEYTFHEKVAPEGYEVVTDIKFSVGEDGTVKVVEKSENDKAEATGNKLTVTDKAIPKGNEEQPKGDKEDPKGNEDKPKGDKEDPKGNEDKPKGDKEDPKGNEDKPKGDNEDPKGNEEQPKGDNEDPKGNEEQPKGDNEDPKGNEEQPKGDNEGPKGNEEQPKGDNEDPKGNEEQPKGDNEGPKGNEEQPKGDNEGPKGNEEQSKGDNEGPKGNEEQPKGDNEQPEEQSDTTTNSDQKLASTGTQTGNNVASVVLLFAGLGLLGYKRRRN